MDELVQKGISYKQAVNQVTGAHMTEVVDFVAAQKAGTKPMPVGVEPNAVNHPQNRENNVIRVHPSRKAELEEQARLKGLDYKDYVEWASRRKPELLRKK